MDVISYNRYVKVIIVYIVTSTLHLAEMVDYECGRGVRLQR